MSRKILGIDIRTGAVSAVLLQSKIKGASIEAQAYSPISANTTMKDAVANCISTLMKQTDLSGAACIAAYPSEKIFYRNIGVPFKEQKKIRQVLPYELEPALPLPVEDLIVDFCVSGSGNSNSHTELLAGAAEMAGLKSFLEMLADFQLAPAILTAGGFAAASCIAKNGDLSSNGCFLIDVGQKNCSIFGIAAGRVCYARSFPLRLGAQTQAAVICHHLRQTFEPVEEILRAPLKPDCILLTGHGAENEGLVPAIAQELGMPVKTADLVDSAAVDVKNCAGPDWQPSRLNNALALALVESEGLPVLNFRRGPLAPRKHWVEHKQHLILTGILTGAILAFAFFDVTVDNYFMAKRVARLDAQITGIFQKTFPDIQKIVNPLQQMRVEIKKIQGQSLFPESLEKHVRNIDVLHDISTLIPDNVDVALNRIVIGPGSVTISGHTDTFNSVNGIQGQLQGSTLFKSVTINSANIEKTGNRVSFNLNIQL